MLVPADKRTDRTVPVITIFLDGKNTSVEKKFKCSICGGTVFSYRDTLNILVPTDTATPEGSGYINEGALDSVECTHFIKNEMGRRIRCRTFYLLTRESPNG